MHATPQPGQLPAPAAQPFSISGNLVSARYGYPLPGLRVSAYSVEPRDPASEGEDSAHAQPDTVETLLGTGSADRHGGFQIAFRDTPGVRQKLCALTQFAEMSIVLKVEGDDGRLYYTSEPLSATAGSIVVTLPVPLPAADVTGDTWTTLGARLEEARLTQLNLLAQQLAIPDGQTLFADWNLETRQAVLNQLEQAFLDPQNILREAASPLPTLSDLRAPGTLEAFQERLQPHLENPEVQKAFMDFSGKAQSFADLFSVDWTMDLNDFRQGNAGLALNKYIDNYRAGVDRIFDRLAALRERPHALPRLPARDLADVDHARHLYRSARLDDRRRRSSSCAIASIRTSSPTIPARSPRTRCSFPS